MSDRDPQGGSRRSGLDVPSRPIAPLPPLSTDELDTATKLPPDLEGAPISEELTGRASKTDEDLKSLFSNESEDHLEDGFKGGSGDDPDSATTRE